MPEITPEMMQVIDIVKTVSLMVLIFGVFAFFIRAMNSHVSNIITHMESIQKEFTRLNRNMKHDMTELKKDINKYRRTSTEVKSLLDERVKNLESRIRR